MLRLIFLLIIGFIIFSIWQYLHKYKGQTQSKAADDVEPMVKCAFCNVYVAQSTSTKGADGQWYCCADHALRARS